MTAVSWQTLVQVREAGERSAQHQVSRDADTVAVTGHRLFAAQCDWMSSRQAGLQHRQALQRVADEGRATVAALRHGAHWDQALTQRLASTTRAVREAEGVHAQAEALLDISRAELRRASAQLEKARHLDEQTRRAQARARERRLDEQADDAALQRRTMPRRA